jgi:hypothetical protein
MTAITILNILLSAIAVVGILALMGWGIATDRVRAASLGGRSRRSVARRPADRRASDRRSGADRRFGPLHPAR